MKKHLLLLMLLAAMLLLVSCKNKKYEQTDYGDSYVPEQDAQTFTVVKSGAYTDKGFYAVNAGSGNIDFIDCANKKAAPLCSRPECKHNDDSCSAHFNNLTDVIAYDGYIYAVAQSENDFMATSLYRLSPDGSEKVELRELFRTEEENDASCSYELIIHRGCGYMVINWQENNRSNKRKQSLYRIPLTGKERTELFSFEGYEPLIHILFADKNNVYFTASCYDEADYANITDHDYRLDIMTDEITEIKEPDGYSMLAGIDNRIYSMLRSDDNIKVFSMDESGNDAKEMYTYDNTMPLIFRDRNYLYLDNELYVSENPDMQRRIMVIDYDGNTVRDIAGIGISKSVIWSDMEKILFYDMDTGQYSIYDIKTGNEIVTDTYQAEEEE